MNNQDFYKKLIKGIKKLHRSHKLYRILKRELSAQSHWKQKPRGKNIKDIKNVH